ncbi:hypothetical protein EUA02_26835 [Mycobacterium paragordonae]|uniref:hypothetical protein n=1 Tax=Mycobacterium paragordonae TaxID=1389713 RepID=UPI00105F06C8|nr:hypothetical protein [Mycobacterium paragordonae]TDK87545.1 hypothetical protein EUA02_26835 [Mycobacterium paragordonae]TDL01124.1 hypothetical protein EUA05_28620 [Mycobacterium paragordonae]
MSALQVEFVDFTDPQRQDAAERTREFAEILRANPGRWAKWPNPMAKRSARSRASDINVRRIPGCPKALLRGGFEARCRNGELFVRHVGGRA